MSGYMTRRSEPAALLVDGYLSSADITRLSEYPQNLLRLFTQYDDQTNCHWVICKRLCEKILWSYIDQSSFVNILMSSYVPSSLFSVLPPLFLKFLLFLFSSAHIDRVTPIFGIIKLPTYVQPRTSSECFSIDGPDLLQGTPKLFIIFKRCYIIKINNY